VIKALAPPKPVVDTMSHHVFRVPLAQKWSFVAHLAAREERTILFVRTKHGAERLAENLRKAGVPAGALHGGRSQSQRTRALNDFKDGSVPALVATDVAARGIHVDDVSLVVHVDPPADSKDYLHRSGRTARAGESGIVITITTAAEERAVRSLLSDAGVQANHRDAHPGDSDTVQLTGAREPSGVPVIEKKQPASGHGQSDRSRNRGPRTDARPARSRRPSEGASGARRSGRRPATGRGNGSAAPTRAPRALG
jgi:superfamily II DNA/RNA helicase